MAEAKGGNPGKPAESLESPFFDHFIPFFSPSLLCESFQDLSLSAGIWGGQRGPQAQTDGQAANQTARTVLPWSAVPCCQGLKHRIIHGVFVCVFFFFKENQNSQGKYILKKRNPSPPRLRPAEKQLCDGGWKAKP